MSAVGWKILNYAAVLAALTFPGMIGTTQVLAAGECKFKPLRPVTLKNMGPCQFDAGSKRFAGSAIQQAACLMTPVLQGGKLGAPLESFPAGLSKRIDQETLLPDRRELYALLEARGFEKVFGFNLAQPVAHAEQEMILSQADAGSQVDASDAPPPPWHAASYFVIHDTSGPNYRGRPWPGDMNDGAKLNNLENHSCTNRIERAHVFINRRGEAMMSHDFEIPWRATKFEAAVNFGLSLKGLFLHVELIQPRRRASGYRGQNDFQAPDPGFTSQQYDTLALTYMVASLRAGRWLIPAYHAVLDDGIYDKHDDPQNFEIEKFVQSLDYLTVALSGKAVESAPR